jgi:hypothetical protein
MAAYDEYNLRQDIGAILYLEGLIVALEARVEALENPEALIAPVGGEEEEENA